MILILFEQLVNKSWAFNCTNKTFQSIRAHLNDLCESQTKPTRELCHIKQIPCRRQRPFSHCPIFPTCLFGILMIKKIQLQVVWWFGSVVLKHSRFAALIQYFVVDNVHVDRVDVYDLVRFVWQV